MLNKAYYSHHFSKNRRSLHPYQPYELEWMARSAKAMDPAFREWVVDWGDKEQSVG